MSRQEKGSRMRMLPPRVQLQQRDALTGSYPTNVRFSTDGRTGNYKVNFDDTSVVDFVTTTQSSSYSAPQNLGLEYSPLALYTFDGNINDQSGNSYNLSLHSGSLQYTDGPFYGSQAILFDGYNSLTSSVISALQITGAVTLQAFIKSNTTTVSSVGKAVASLAGIGESLKTNILYSMFVDGDNKAGSFGYDIEKGLGVDVSEFSIASLLQPGKWYHIAIARNGSSNNKLYLNGTLITSFTSLNFPEKDVSGNLQRLIVGTHPNSVGDYQAFAYKGAVSNLKIVNRELTVNEIKSEFERIFPEGILAGVGFPIASKWIQNRIGLDLPTSGGISSPGNVASQVIENLPFFHFTPGQELTPFRDNDQPAVDGKSQNNPFFATGSSPLLIGEGFSSPLWSKNKIEIDLSVNTAQTLKIDLLNDENSQQMSYFNFQNKTWEALSDISLTDSNIRSGSLASLQGKDITIGFAPSLGVPRVYVPAAMGDFVHGYCFMKTAGTQIGNFGFPLNSRYYATSSQQYEISNNIQHPFLLEKVVLIVSMSTDSYYPIYSNQINDGFVAAPLSNGPYTAAGYSEKTILPFITNNFFILHQRENAGNLRMFSDLASTNGTSIIPNNGVTSERNLITNLRITSVNRPEAAYWNTGGITLDGGYEPTIGGGAQVDLQTYLSEHNHIHIDPSGVSCDIQPAQQLVVSGTVKLSKLLRDSYVVEGLARQFPGFSAISQSPTNVNKVRTLSSGLTVSVGSPTSIGFKSNVESGGRNGLGFNRISNRDFISPANVDLAESIRYVPNGTGTVNGQSVTLNHYVAYLSDTEQTNPYILMPGDRLVFGWQLPAPFGNIHNQSGTFLDMAVSTTICPGMKIIIYGSYIRSEREYNEGTNQLLSSNSIHEVIE